MKSKWIKIIMMLMVAMFAASIASADIILTTNSEEMMAYSTCDRAGRITLTLTNEDLGIISGHLATEDYVQIRVTLTGTDIDAGATPPELCRAISGTETGEGQGAQGGDLPNISNSDDGYVLIDSIAGGEVSDVCGDDEITGTPDLAPDVTAYVYGANGNRYFDIFITDVQSYVLDDSNPGGQQNLTVGLYNDLLDAEGDDTDTTAICANVEDFGGLSKLTTSYNFDPETLTLTGANNEIGHFLDAEFDCRTPDQKMGDCGTLKGTSELDINCEGAALKQDDEECDPDETCCVVRTSGTQYIVVEGDYPTSGDITLIVRSNGAADEDSTQRGVYISSVTVYNVDGEECTNTAPTLSGTVTLNDADGDELDEDYDDEGPCSFYLTEQYLIEGLDASAISSRGDKIIIAVNYFFIEEEGYLAIGDQIVLWTEIMTEPCGAIANCAVDAAEIVDCAVVWADCMYFPYVLTGMSPWGTGVVITNMDVEGKPDEQVAVEDMVAKLILFDGDGKQYTKEMDDFESAVSAFMMDDISGWEADMGGPAPAQATPAAGPAWLKVVTNFHADGYSFLTNGDFGAGTLPRLACCVDHDEDCDESSALK
jgi:hypothetical protein